MHRYVILTLVCLFVGSHAAGDRIQDRINVTITGPGHDRVVVCYVAAWAVYRPARGSFGLDNIDPTLCTHLVYAFAGLNITTNTITSLDPYNDLEEDYGKGSYKKMTAMRLKHPHLKVTLAIGGWNQGSTNYSILAASPVRREAFIRSVTDYIRKYNFDGLDLDWEFPGKRGGAADDKDNFILLVKELRSAFDKHGWLLTAALGAAPDTIEVAYNVPALGNYLDYMHIMCYDYHGAWDRMTGSNTPLPKQTDKFSVEDSIENLIKLGAPRHKLVLGLSMYGRTFVMTNAKDFNTEELGSKAEDKGFQGPLTREDGFLGYNEICLEIGGDNSTWKKYYDEKTQTPYAVNENKVITYDDAKSLTEKVKYSVEKDLAGLMVWAIDNDDFRGDCESVKFPLMRAINKAVVLAQEEKQNRVIEDNEKTKSNAAVSVVLSQVCLAFVLALLVH